MKAVALEPRPLIIPDSAITLPRRPIVLPDIARKWRMYVVTAWRIGRLGKGIERKFASRYIEAYTAAIVTLPVADEYTPLAEGMDSTLTLGEWLPYEEGAVSRYEMALDSASGTLNDAPAVASAMVERISHTMTLKTGDILLGPVAIEVYPPRGRERMSLSIGGRTVLKVRVIS